MEKGLFGLVTDIALDKNESVVIDTDSEIESDVIEIDSDASDWLRAWGIDSESILNDSYSDESIWLTANVKWCVVVRQSSACVHLDDY